MRETRGKEDWKMPQRGQRQGKEQNPQIEVSFVELKKTGDTFQSTIAAFVRRGSKPVGGAAIQFYLDYKAFGNPVTTGADGRATLPAPGLKEGHYTIGAQIVGTATKAEKIMPVGGNESQVELLPPAVRAEGDAGDYLISVLASDKQRHPVKGLYVRFLISPKGKPAFVHDEETDETGFAIYHLTFGEHSCNVTVQVAGFEVELKNLQGPSRAPKPPAIPEWERSDLEGGLWACVRRAWKRGGEELRNQRRAL